MRVIAFTREGDNIFDSTLGDGVIDCVGLNDLILPFVIVRGVGKPGMRGRRARAAMTTTQATILFTSHLYLYLDVDGWRYKALSPVDFYLPDLEATLAGRRSYGPFATSEDAARDAVTTLQLPRGSWYAGLADMCAPDTELARAAAVLAELLESPQWEPPSEMAGKVRAP